MLLDESVLPEWFNYPKEFTLLKEQNLLDFDPWIILTDWRLQERYQGIQNRYPSRQLVPFARREDNDDLACFERNKGIVIIHDFASAGYEGGQQAMEFWDWLRLAIEDMIEYNS